MKNILSIMYLIGFVLGIALIMTSDTGFFASSFSANLAGTIICAFSGINLTVFMNNHHIKK